MTARLKQPVLQCRPGENQLIMNAAAIFRRFAESAAPINDQCYDVHEIFALYSSWRRECQRYLPSKNSSGSDQVIAEYAHDLYRIPYDAEPKEDGSEHDDCLEDISYLRSAIAELFQAIDEAIGTDSVTVTHAAFYEDEDVILITYT